MAYSQAWGSRPQRAEPLYELARYYREQKQFETACQFALQDCQIKHPRIFYLLMTVSTHGVALDELSVAASYCPHYKENNKKAILKLLMKQKIPYLRRSTTHDQSTRL
ncbi:hypothetical protein [Acinetobacter sp. ANC 4173]|uniref:hypothetical protein n=1 Tax=Acinetobacter sp. ANC 4173 TaxID=2529837 RepID=UPI001D0D8465|nr:hypothetical protein [Acinetobacter sp. ANC 4173]